jgi:hypothetical protein
MKNKYSTLDDKIVAWPRENCMAMHNIIIVIVPWGA